MTRDRSLRLLEQSKIKSLEIFQEFGLNWTSAFFLSQVQRLRHIYILTYSCKSNFFEVGGTETRKVSSIVKWLHTLVEGSVCSLCLFVMVLKKKNELTSPFNHDNTVSCFCTLWLCASVICQEQKNIYMQNWSVLELTGPNDMMGK